MAIYTIIPASDGSGFHIGVVGHDGTRHTMLGFESIAEAEAWIVHDKRFSISSDELQENESRA